MAGMRGRDGATKANANLRVPEEALKSAILIHKDEKPEEMARPSAVWRTENATLMARRLDASPYANALMVG